MEIQKAIEILEAKKKYYAMYALKFADTDEGFKYLIRYGACGLGVENLKRRQQNG